MALWKRIKEFLNGKPVAPANVLPQWDTDTPTPEPHTPVQAHADTAGRQTKIVLHPFVKPTLYFSGWGFDERNGSKSHRANGDNVSVMKADGQTYYLRNFRWNHIFRKRGDTDERAALFVANDLDRPWPYRHTIVPVEFNRIITEQKFGRFLLYIADCMVEGQCAYLGFLPDGSGITLDDQRMEMASFHWQEATDQSWEELLTASPELLRPLCKLLFETQINPRSLSPYIDSAILEDIPHQFLTGSEEELRRLTLAIVQTEPGLFDTNLEPVTVTYRAKTPNKRGGMTRIEQKNASPAQGRITSLCDLAARLNTFTGIEWKSRVPNPNRLAHWEKQIHRVRVVAHPPSAHERAESLLILAEWLEGKVREPKRLRLLGIEE